MATNRIQSALPVLLLSTLADVSESSMRLGLTPCEYELVNNLAGLEGRGNRLVILCASVQKLVNFEIIRKYLAKHPHLTVVSEADYINTPK